MKLVVTIILMACYIVVSPPIIYSQTNKIKVEPADFSKWSTLNDVNISPNGEWIRYQLKYELGKDTLFIMETHTAKKYDFPSGKEGDFSRNGKWFFTYLKEGVQLQNLKTGEQKTFNSASKASFLEKGKFLLTRNGDRPQYTLSIWDLEKDEHHRIHAVKEYVISPNKKSIGFITNDNRVGVFWSENTKTKILLSATAFPRKNLVWNADSNALAVLEETQIKHSSSPGHKIYFVKNISQKEKQILKILDGQQTAKGKKIVWKPPYTPLLIAPDNQRIFFYIAPVDLNKKRGDIVEIWNSKSRVEYKRGRLMGSPEDRPKLTVWNSESQKFTQIANKRYPSVYLTPDKKKALIFDPFQYEPQPEVMGPADMWLINLNAGKQKLFLKKQTQKLGRLGASPNSRYLNYYNQKNWWVYDIKKDTHTKVTANLRDIEYKKGYKGSLLPPYGFAGWTADSQFLILYTQYDIWLISADGKQQERLTNDRTKKVRYRVVNPVPNLLSRDIYDLWSGECFDLNKGLIIEAYNTTDQSSGYYKWTKDRKLVKLVFKSAKINQLKKAANQNSYVFVEQKSNLSPQIVFLDESRETEEKILVKTNKQQIKYKWGGSELISYKNSNGQKLQGVLRFPGGYQPGKKYPMIVYIYEDQPYLLHKYNIPSFYNPAGFSPSNYTTDGYLVFYPSIVYKFGEPGYSAVDCVEAAVKKVMEMGIVQEESIGLIGHSYGGYEANFIATQSKLFSAIVAGAALSDLVSHSLTLNASGRSEMWRYQTHQLRMGNALYDDYKGFVENSPITYAQNINTALLNWTGKNDRNVDPQQSKAMNMAMRSLKKEHVLLLYPNEGHVLSKPAAQKNLTIKIKAWFDHYLKGNPLLPGLDGENNNAE